MTFLSNVDVIIYFLNCIWLIWPCGSRFSLAIQDFGWSEEACKFKSHKNWLINYYQ